jgi:hypothetical protein
MRSAYMKKLRADEIRGILGTTLISLFSSRLPSKIHKINFSIGRTLGHRLRVFEKMVLSRISTKEDGTEGWGRLNNDELHNLHVSRNIIRQVKEDVMGTEHSADEIDKKHKIFLFKILKGDLLKELIVYVKIILEWILRIQIGRVWSGCNWFRMAVNGGPL